MPLLITPATAFQNDACLDIASVYAIIEQVGYRTRDKCIAFAVGYYASEAAYVALAARLHIQALPADLVQPATPEEANAVPIFQFLEQVLTASLRQLLGEGTTIESVA